MDSVKQAYKSAQRFVRSHGNEWLRTWASTAARENHTDGHIPAHEPSFTVAPALLQSQHAEQPGELSGVDLNRAKVLFLRQNAIGDALISTPVFVALKRHYPDLTIDVLLNRRNREIYENDENIRRTYIIKMRPLDLIPVLRLIRREKYDFIVDLVHSPSSTSSAVCLLAGARRTIGGAREDPSRHPPEQDYAYDIRIPTAPPSEQDRMLRRLAQCLRIFGINPAKERLVPAYQCRNDSVVFAEQLLSKTRTPATEHIIGINISGAKAYKYWGTDNFIGLIKRLTMRHPTYRFLLLYSEQYESEAKTISRESGAATTGGTSTLDSFAAVIQRLDGLISPDSAAVHFADSAGVPTVSLMIDPVGHELWYPSSSYYRVLHAENHEIGSISVDSVAQAFEQLTPVIGR